MKSLLSLAKSKPSCATTLAATLDYLKKRGRLELWTGVIAAKSLERADAETAANREAESAYVRKTAWGSNGNGAAKMHDTYLGDVTHVHETKTQSAGAGNLVKGLLGAGLLASGIGAPIGAMFIADALRQPAPVIPDAPPAAIDTDTDTLFQLRLGKPDGETE